jgi:hypothetical protein
VDGTPAELSRKLAAVLANTGMPGVLTIDERTDERVLFRPSRSVPGMGLARCERGEATFRSAGDGRTLVEFALEFSTRNWLLWLGRLFLVLGLALIGVLYLVLDRYALPSANPGVRAQVWQMVQSVHLLWPPFTFAILHAVGRRSARNQMQSIVQNLPYTNVQALGRGNVAGLGV